MSSRRLVWVTLCAAIVVVAASSVGCYHSIRAQSAAADAVIRTQEATLALERSLSVLRDAETGQRGYLLTLSPDYLRPYRQALAEYAGTRRHLQELAADPVLGRSLPRLDALAGVKLDELARTIALAQQGHREDAERIVLTDEGKNTMDSMRDIVAELQAQERQTLYAELERQARARSQTRNAVVVMAVLSIAILGVLVTVFRRESRALRASEQYLGTVLRSIGDAVIATDVDGRVTLCNPVAGELLGATVRHAVGRPLDAVFRIIGEDSRLPVDNPIKKVLESGRVQGLANHTALLRPDGSEIPIEDSAAPIAGSDGEIIGVVLVFRDATPARTTERLLREADRRKDQFLAVLAHELRNPLAPIRQASLLARSERATQDQRRWSLEVIDRQVGHMARLLDDLLDISRIAHGTIEVSKTAIELEQTLGAAVEMARPLIDSRRHTLLIELPERPVPLHGDAFRLAQVFTNLLTNAAKYTASGGQIRVHAGVEGEAVVIRVVDNGAGLAHESLSAIFEMFAQVESPLDRPEGGLGIGLALAKGLVELHGGTIHALSPGLGQGSEFVVTLPLGRALPVEAAPVQDTPRGASAALDIVVADDNRDAAESLAWIVRAEGHRVHVAYDGEEAWSLIERHQPDIAFLDVGMPEMNGYDVARRVRASTPPLRTRLVALTGWGQAGDLERASAAGFDCHHVKPIEMATVLDLCEEAAAQKRILES